jgi:hypothetical protein
VSDGINNYRNQAIWRDGTASRRDCKALIEFFEDIGNPAAMSAAPAHGEFGKIAR